MQSSQDSPCAAMSSVAHTNGDSSSDRNNGDSPTYPSQTQKQIRETSRLILDVFFEYALNKISHARDQSEEVIENFLSTIGRFVEVRAPIQACLPAFPFKSANKVYKVLGSLPDKAEELALGRLNTMCASIQDIYTPGAQVLIISDGITYNDLLCISDRDTWAYGEALRRMAVEKQFNHISFSRLQDLLELPLPQKLSEIIYVANCTNFRRLLLNKYGRPNLDIDHEIATNPDTKLTYLGYKRFLESDLQHIFPRGANRSAHSYKRDCKYLAKQMLMRGDAFAEAIKKSFPNHLRLSIHESISGIKVSISLLNTKTGFTTPWHCSVAQLANGEWTSAPVGEFFKDERLELVYTNGQPSHFKSRPLEDNPSDMDFATESFIQQAKPLSASEYLKKAFTPRMTSSPLIVPSDDSSVSSHLGTESSRATTPDCQSPPNIFPSSPPSAIGGILDGCPPPEDSLKTTSAPYGKRLIPQIMDSLAAEEPDRIVFSLARSCDGSLKYNEISASTFTKAVDKTTWWLRSQIGKSDMIQPVGYIGPHDLRHVLLTYACVKAGYVALFLSPKNNTEGALAVLESTKCNIWVNASEVSPVCLVKEIVQKRSMHVLQLPPLLELLDCESVEAFEYTKSFDEVINDPFCILHTSGSTGVPKPIIWSHGLIGTMDAVRLLPRAENDDDYPPWTSDWKEGDRIYSSFPMSHGAGIIMNILMPAFFNLQCIIGPAGVLPNMNLVEELADKAKIDIWSMVPSLVDELGETPEVLSKLKSSKFICASGGPVSPVSAGKVNDVIRVLNLTGTTEGLFIGNLVPPREDWFWFCFHPYSGFEFKEIEPDTFEHWVHRNEHWPLFQGIFHTFPDNQLINLKDLYKRHPTKPNLWAFKGRSDDLVVLSNGYKISPLETEAFISTHPAIKGCIVFGTGKPQAGLLVELHDPFNKSDEITDSIWEKINEANSMSRHKNQLLREFVTFAEPDKPFCRTDKGTIKRPATLKLYTDYIERFYISRSDELPRNFALDTSSNESIRDGLREIFTSSVPNIGNIPYDADLFALGLDSLGVFAVIKVIRSATRLGDQIGQRHIYANPTIANLSETIAAMVADEKRASDATPNHNPADNGVASMRSAISRHRARQPFTLNAFDYVNPNHGMGLVLYFPIHDGVSYEKVFANLQEGLNRTFDLIPALSGKMMKCSVETVGYSKGDLCVTIPPLSMAASFRNRLVFKDCSDILPSFEELRKTCFAPSAFKDSLVLRDDPFPEMPADIFVGQANFVAGGCILAIDVNHCCLDGLGVIIALRAWAENCRYLQGDKSATCSWYDPESFNHSLPEILHQEEGWRRPLHEVDPSTWGFLPFFPPDQQDQIGRETTKETKPVQIDTIVFAENTASTALPQSKFPLHSVWPLPCAKRCLKTTLFLITPEKLETMKQEVMADPEAKGITSISDILQAFFWRAAIRARYRVATDLHKQTFEQDEESILELPTDGRQYFSSLLPSTYMGSMLILNRISMSIKSLCSDETSIGRVAFLLRQSTARITPTLVHDAFTILQSLPDHSRFSTANMGLDHMHAMISNMMMFPMNDICFGNAFFAGGGFPESMRPQIERGNGRFRFLAIFPIKRDGGVELVLGTHPEELEMFQQDEEFTKYAKLVDTCC